MQLDVKRKGVSKKVMVLGQKGGFGDKCRSGWSDLAGAHGFDPNGATIQRGEAATCNSLIRKKHGSNERSFRGIERGQSHRIIKDLKGPLSFSGYR